MTYYTLFIVEVALGLGFSILVIALLNTCLREVLTEICGTATRAAFWMTFTRLMLVIGPMLFIILFSDLRPGVATYPAEEIKDAVVRSLFAIFIAIAMIGRVIRKAASNIPAANATARTATPVLEAR